MLRCLFSILVCSLFLGVSCNKPTANEKTDGVAQTNPVSKEQAAADAVQVSAYLIYDDETVDKTDLLSAADIELFNTVIGEGYAKKPAHRVKLVFTGNLDGLYAQLEEYGRVPVTEKFPEKSRTHEIVMKDIGCKTIHIAVRDSNTVLYENMLPFGCGE